jgi:hypothetical protein
LAFGVRFWTGIGVVKKSIFDTKIDKMLIAIT